LAAAGFCNFSIGNGDLRINVAGGTGVGTIAARIGEPNQASTLGTPGGGLISAVDLNWDQDSTLNVFEGTPGDMAMDFDDDGVIDLTATVVVIGNPFATFEAGRFLFRTFGLNRFRIEPLFATVINTAGFGQGGFSTAVTSATEPSIVLNTSNGGDGFGWVSAGDEITTIIDNLEISRHTATGFGITDGLALRLPHSSAPPFACSGTAEGAAYWDTSDNEQCNCDGTNWVLVSDATTVCT
jgi:hypothetical protein